MPAPRSLVACSESYSVPTALTNVSTSTHHRLFRQTAPIPEARLCISLHPIIVSHRVLANGGNDPCRKMQDHHSIDEREEQMVRQVERDVGDAVKDPAGSARE